MPATLNEDRIRAVIHRSRDHGRRDAVVVAILAAYPSIRAGLASMLQVDEAIRPATVQVEALLSPESASTALPLATDVVLIDPAEVPREALTTLRDVTRDEELRILWIGTPPMDVVALGCSVVGQNVEAATLALAVRAVAAGLIVTDPDVPASVPDDEAPEHAGMSGPLSPREQEVLQLVATGLPNKAIARELGISDHTVKFHVSSLLTKLDASSRTEAVTIATRRGLLFL